MKNKLVGIWNFHQICNNRQIWLNDQVNINDGIKYSGGVESLRSFQYFCNELSKSNVDIKILNEIDDLNKVDLFIFSNFDKKNKMSAKVLKINKPKYLLLTEAKAVLPEMWNKNVYSEFNKIFTWDDSLIDDKKFFKINCPGFDVFDKPVNFFLKKKKEKKFCVITASNKKSNHPMSIYHKRLEIINWFEKFYPNELDFFGWDWDKHVFTGSILSRILNRFSIIQKIFSKKFKTYKGPIKGSKVPVYENYTFSICFENTVNDPGYITEKIFDSFFAGCIPIYFGGNNLIENYIPENTFINYYKFSNIEDLYIYLKKMSDQEKINYIKNIENFLNSSKFFIFTNEYYKKTLLDQARIDLKL